MIVFSVAVLAEILADKIPVVDHALDTVQTIVKPVAGTILAASVLTELSPLQAAVLGLITGGVVAEAVHLTKANLRVASTATSAGLANPVISVIEDVMAFIGVLLAVVVPVVMALLVTVLVIAAWRMLRRLTRRGEVNP